jgi:twitching motility two-component system response regulator PilH
MARILIAEDSDTEVAFLNEILQTTPHDLTFARDGLEAEASARQGDYDVIILDVIMPGKNGFKVCRNLKNDPSKQKTPIILLTSKSETSDRYWGMKQGANAYITKPYNPDALLEEIDRQLAS